MYRRVLATLGFGFAGCLVAFGTVALTPSQLDIYYFDVGQGDGIFIRTPYGQHIVIDGGPDHSFGNKVGSAMPWYDRHIDLILLTHPHADHVTGLIDVLTSYRVDRLLSPEGDSPHTDAVHTFLELAEKKGVMRMSASRGERYELGPDLTLTLLAPEADAGDTGDLNDRSIVAMLEYKSQKFLFMGDLGGVEEERLVERENLHADTLKVGHHGSRTSTSDAFLDEVAPRVAIISAGTKNLFGHPHTELLQRLAEENICVARTDLHGDVRVAGDGKILSVTTSKKAPPCLHEIN